MALPSSSTAVAAAHNVPPVGSDPGAFEFRVGGREHASFGPVYGPTHAFDAVYRRIFPERSSTRRRVSS